MTIDNTVKVLLTGATGFVGQAIARQLSENARYQLLCAIRRDSGNPGGGFRTVMVGDLSGETDWSQALGGIHTVIHAAGRSQVSGASQAIALEEFRKVNLQGTLNLARQAATANVRRFIFISSVKVNGEMSQPGSPFREDDAAAPSEAYGISKWEAEVALRQVAEDTGMEYVIIRAPLVYGPGVRGNFLRMMQWASSGFPLPLGSVRNARSLVALDNLVDLIGVAIDHPAASNQIFFAADGQDLSTPALLRRLGRLLGKPARLIPVPASLIYGISALLGKRHLAHRLCGFLQVDISKSQKLLGWHPVVSLDEALQKTVDHFKSRQGQ